MDYICNSSLQIPLLFHVYCHQWFMFNNYWVIQTDPCSSWHRRADVYLLNEFFIPNFNDGYLQIKTNNTQKFCWVSKLILVRHVIDRLLCDWFLLCDFPQNTDTCRNTYSCGLHSCFRMCTWNVLAEAPTADWMAPCYEKKFFSIKYM